MRLSYVIVARDAQNPLLHTLAHLQAITPLTPRQWEMWVVDNASGDGTAHAVVREFGGVNLLRNPTDEGLGGATHAIRRCAGQYIIVLNADQRPEDGRTISGLLSHLDHRPEAAAVVGRGLLPDGGQVGPCLATAVLHGATCYRRQALIAAGGFTAGFEDQAHALDVSLRLWNGGGTIERREEAMFLHEPAQAREARQQSLAARRELRNHLLLAQRWLPAEVRRIYAHDWRLRCGAVAAKSGRGLRRAALAARMRGLRESIGGRRPVSPAVVEHFFGLRQHAAAVGDWARRNSVWRVVLADFGPNLWATYNACRACGLQIRCVADESATFAGLEYRGLPIVPAYRAFEGGGIDGVVLANLNPVQSEARYKSLRQMFKGPVLRLWQPSRLATQTIASAA